MTDLDPRNNLPGSFDGYNAWSGNPPTSKLSPTGEVFWGLNATDAAGLLWYVVISIDPAGHRTLRLKLGPGVSPGAGQGELDVDNGWLVVTYFTQAGNRQPSKRVAVPGWVRWPDLHQPEPLTPKQVDDLNWVSDVRSIDGGTP